MEVPLELGPLLIEAQAGDEDAFHGLPGDGGKVALLGVVDVGSLSRQRHALDGRYAVQKLVDLAAEVAQQGLLKAQAQTGGVIRIDDPKGTDGGLGQERVLSLESCVDDAARGQRLDDGGIEGGLLAVVERGETLKQFVSGVPGNRRD